MSRTLRFGRLALAASLATGLAHAEPMFLARQYTRCSTCHFSAAGGGLLTPYGRSLSREELSTTGRGTRGGAREHEFLFGALGEGSGPVSLGIDLRPSRFDVDFVGGSLERNLLMNAELQAAYAKGSWTLYASLGRQPLGSGTKVDSFEHWVGYQGAKGFGVRAGRFLPAYGVRLSDHTAFTRRGLGFDTFDQLYALELSHASERHLLQLSLGPGRADSILNDDGRRAFTATGRFQLDLSPRASVVLSGLMRDDAPRRPRNGSAGAALGFAPARRLSVWSEGNAQFQKGSSGAPAYTLLNETSFEAYRGVWLSFSPQLRTQLGRSSAGVVRTELGLSLLPRTHWNLRVAYYRDRDRVSDRVTRTWLAQLHLYL